MLGISKEWNKSQNGLEVYHIESSLCSGTWKCQQTSTCQEVPPNICNVKCNTVYKSVTLKIGQEEGRADSCACVQVIKYMSKPHLFCTIINTDMIGSSDTEEVEHRGLILISDFTSH